MPIKIMRPWTKSGLFNWKTMVISRLTDIIQIEQQKYIVALKKKIILKKKNQKKKKSKIQLHTKHRLAKDRQRGFFGPCPSPRGNNSERTSTSPIGLFHRTAWKAALAVNFLLIFSSPKLAYTKNKQCFYVFFVWNAINIVQHSW